MSRLVRLYPRAWRMRYEAELRDALANRPVTRHDRIGLVRGAVDARLHPELATPPPGRLAPVGGDPSEALIETRSPFPWTMFLGVLAAGCFAWAAMLVAGRESRLWGDGRLQGVLLTVAVIALGVGLWRNGASRVLTRVGGLAMVCLGAGLLARGWSDPQTMALPLAVGGLFAGAGGVVDRRPGRLTGLLLLALIPAVLWSSTHSSIRGTAVVLLGYALVSVRIAAPELRLERAVTALVGGLVAVGVVLVALSQTDPWSRHDGYALGCHTDAATCVSIADRLASRMRGHAPGERVLAIEVRADGLLWACYTLRGSAVAGGCRLGADDGWPTDLPPGDY